MIKNRKIAKSFISFLIASILMWFLITLSREYTTSITFPVNYKNIPQDKLLQNKPIKEIDIIVKSTGFNLIRSGFGDKTITLNANSLHKKSTGSYYFLTRNQVSTIQKQLHSGLELQEIVLDTIYLDIGTLTSKKVALKPNLEIKYQIGYDILEPVCVKPDSILISGPETQINKITYIDLKLLKLDNIREDFSEKIEIVLPKNLGNIKFTSKFTTISGKVEKFTEGTLEVPFTISNLPKGVELTTLNKTVEVVYVVGLSNFNKIDKNFFEVVCDYNVSKDNNLGYLLPKVIGKPDYVKSFKVIPNKIDFLIQK
ncbi:CdaR family protein [Polaribacter sp. NJDZ03]|uniref:CdaR family protein n=1 Tax=Polaribacter sp. NJDZ03 TaxID=2855841 RepID=UPI001C4A581D|nr:YbbR-like domain-containing protein [Polaribacter sp. NJDZ03]